MASGKRCHYEVLDLQRDCSADEIRSAYRRLALQRHPDKLVKSGLSQADATAQFQELQHAYEVLSDPKERAWYDSHRSQILFSDPTSVGNSVPNSVIPNLFSFFSNTVYSGYADSGKGFYKVYSDVFDKIHSNELNFARTLGLCIDSVRQAPVMGNLDSPYTQVTAFYNYWFSFSTVMDFCWVDQYDVMAGPNRKSRRVMEEENKKLRKKAKREYNETVRGLAEFVKKRDKRVIDMTMKKNMEMEKKKEEEIERKKRLEKEKKEKAMAYQEPEWAKVEEEEEEHWFEEEEEDKKSVGKEWYCVVCGKKFKSEKQWKNHEQSKKHKEKVAEFRDSLVDDEALEVEVDEEEVEEWVRTDVDGADEKDQKSTVVDDLEDSIRDGLSLAEEESGNGDDTVFLDAEDDTEDRMSKSLGHAVDGDEDDDMGVLQAMVVGHKSKKTKGRRREAKSGMTSTQVVNEDEDADDLGYNNSKSTRKNRRAMKDKGKRGRAETSTAALSDYTKHAESNGINGTVREEFSSQILMEDDTNGKENKLLDKEEEITDQPFDRKEFSKDTSTKVKKSCKGKNSKAATKKSSNLCETCGEEFESRNKLHKHLGDSGHASLKYR